MSVTNPVDRVLVARLKRVYWPTWCDAIARDKRVFLWKGNATYLSQRNRVYDVKRVRYFVDELRAGRRVNPILIDSRCVQYSYGGPISWGNPFIYDGHHRFIAHVLLGSEYIDSHVSGLVAHCEWLLGQRDDYVNIDTL